MVYECFCALYLRFIQALNVTNLPTSCYQRKNVLVDGITRPDRHMLIVYIYMYRQHG